MLASEFYPHMVSDAATLPNSPWLNLMSDIPSNGYRKPADNECILWADRDFNGDSISRTLPTQYCHGGPYTYGYPYEVIDYHLDKANDKMSSYACGKDVAFDFCKGVIADSCRNGNGTSGVGPSKQNKTGWEDTTTTVRLYCNDPERQSAMLYKYPDCQDVQSRIAPSNNPQQPRYYNRSDL